MKGQISWVIPSETLFILQLIFGHFINLQGSIVILLSSIEFLLVVVDIGRVGFMTVICVEDVAVWLLFVVIVCWLVLVTVGLVGSQLLLGLGRGGLMMILMLTLVLLGWDVVLSLSFVLLILEGSYLIGLSIVLFGLELL